MSNNKKMPLTPTEFYKQRRPENFSDSELIQEAVLTRELLAFELSQISNNQKQDQFETLCRRLAEKFIAPNLIPQVGPTGGGDGKTDFETHPVSVKISDRWFIPENGWSNNEKWAFAISAKETWKPKLKSDIKKIISTNRDYTKIFFFTNRTPSSKQKKAAQDEFQQEFGLEITILDAEWILEKTTSNPDITDIIVDSLNLSSVYKPKVRLGSNDTDRLKKLESLEKEIANPNRYFEFDFQLVEDALEAALLSRNIGRSKDEVEGKFERALRFSNKLQNKGQLVRIHYQRAWMYIHYFDDFKNFISAYQEVKNLVSIESTISELELFFNLFNVLKGVVSNEVFDECKAIDLNNERIEIENIIQSHINDESKPSSALIARTFKIILDLWDKMTNQENPDELFNEFSDCLKNSTGHIEYPFEVFKNIIEVYGDIFPDNSAYDSLFETVAEISGNRHSQVSSAEMFIRRGAQKIKANLHKESIVFFGKALLKLAKEESKHGMYLALMGLSMAYKAVGLPWASYNSLITACSIPMKEWYEKGVFDKRMYRCVKEILINELFIGRLPVFLVWNELSNAISYQINVEEEKDSQYSLAFLDAGMSVRLIDSKLLDPKAYSVLPDLLASQELWLSQHSVLYALGHLVILSDDDYYSNAGISNEEELNEYFEKVAHQPLKKQMLCDTDLLSTNPLKFQSVILGVTFTIEFPRNHELFLFAETILAFLESFLATSAKNVYPNSESIIIKLIKNENASDLRVFESDRSNTYTMELGTKDYSKEGDSQLWQDALSFISIILSKNFFVEDVKKYLEALFIEEEVHERCGLIFQHSKLIANVLGEQPKLFFDQWIDGHNFKRFEKLRELPFEIKDEKIFAIAEDEESIKPEFENLKHSDLKAVSIIDDQLWNKATWRAFGSFIDRVDNKLGVFLTFENHEFGKQIFTDWIGRFGRKDENELIRITIIKGVNRNNPNWYRVHITNSMDEKMFLKEKFIISSARFHEMNAHSPDNLSHLIASYNHYREYFFCPARFTNDGRLEPFEELSILKKELYIKNAWEIGLNDFERSAIRPNDQPIIPEGVENAPILEVLEKLKSR